MKEIGGNSRSNTILLPHSPGALRDLTDQIREAIIGGGVTAASATSSGPPGASS